MIQLLKSKKMILRISILLILFVSLILIINLFPSYETYWEVLIFINLIVLIVQTLIIRRTKKMVDLILSFLYLISVIIIIYFYLYGKSLIVR